MLTKTNIDLFRAELNRRIESPDSPHDEESKKRLRGMRVLFELLAAKCPEALEKGIIRTMEEFNVRFPEEGGMEWMPEVTTKATPSC